MRRAKASRSITEFKPIAFKRVLDVLDLFAIGYGDLGSSIFYALGITALFALGATPLALMLAGGVFICTVLTYAELTAMFPEESGGSASYARHAFNDLISFLAGWGLLLDYIVTASISAVAVGPYLSYFFSMLAGGPLLIGFTVSLLLILFVINVFGVKGSTRVSLALSGFTILIQGLIIAVGTITLLNLPYIWNHLHIGVAGASWSPTWHQFWKGTAMAMVAYTGIESIAQLGGETKRPTRTQPRALLLTMFVLLIVYLGISLVALSATTPQELGTTYLLNPIAAIVDGLPYGKDFLAPCLALVAAVVLIVASNAGLMGASRLSYNMGRYYQLPRFFSYISPRFRTPALALAFFAFMAIVVIIASRARLDFLADVYNFGAMIAFCSAHLSLIVLRIKHPHIKRPFTIWLSIPIGKYSIPLTAILGALATFGVWILVVFTKPEGRYLGCAWMIVGVGMYLLYRKKQRIVPIGPITIEQVATPKTMQIHRILVPIRGEENLEGVQMACEIAEQHDASVILFHVVEIPLSLPADTLQGIMIESMLLKKSEAIARHAGLEFIIETVRARSAVASILERVEKDKIDLIVLGWGGIAQRILRKAPCRVLICAKKQ